MKRLYNKYLADDRTIVELEQFKKMIDEYSRNIVKFAIDNDFDLRDANEIATGTIQCDFAEAILRRALNMRREERGEKTLDHLFIKQQEKEETTK